MRLLVLGGTHFLGRHVVTAALERGHDVATFTRGLSGEPPEGVRALQGQWSRAGQASQPLAPLPSDALEARALAAGAAGDAARWAYLDREALRSLGSVPSRLFGKVTTSDWSTAFDGVVVLRDEAAPTFEPRR